MENTKGSRLFVRIPAYVIGLLIMTLGVAISVKSNLGVSPVSSIPYTITCVVGLEMGKATILFHAVLVCPCGYHSAGRGGSNACHLQDH